MKQNMRGGTFAYKLPDNNIREVYEAQLKVEILAFEKVKTDLINSLQSVLEKVSTDLESLQTIEIDPHQ